MTTIGSLRNTIRSLGRELALDPTLTEQLIETGDVGYLLPAPSTSREESPTSWAWGAYVEDPELLNLDAQELWTPFDASGSSDGGDGFVGETGESDATMARAESQLVLAALEEMQCSDFMY
ncbi:hypothetical protein RQP46_009162 [Phenoliferia psychrophenolica]